MIHIDSRESIPTPYLRNFLSTSPTTDMEGAEGFAYLFRQHRAALPTQIRMLPAADFCFTGHASLSSMIGIERKTLKDLLSSKRSGRLAGEQLPKLFDQYDPQLVFLLLESDYRVNAATGALEERFDPYSRKWYPTVIGRQAMLGMELDSFLTTISLKTPITVVHTRNPEETVEFICSLHHYFQEPLHKRHDHIAIHVPALHSNITKASTVRRVAYALDGVGWERSFAVAERVKNVVELVGMTPTQWEELPGFGKTLAKRVWKEIRGEGQPE